MGISPPLWKRCHHLHCACCSVGPRELHTPKPACLTFWVEVDSKTLFLFNACIILLVSIGIKWLHPSLKPSWRICGEPWAWALAKHFATSVHHHVPVGILSIYFSINGHEPDHVSVSGCFLQSATYYRGLEGHLCFQRGNLACNVQLKSRVVGGKRVLIDWLRLIRWVSFLCPVHHRGLSKKQPTVIHWLPVCAAAEGSDWAARRHHHRQTLTVRIWLLCKAASVGRPGNP